jgi:parallel beta-helix repeat protein
MLLHQTTVLSAGAALALAGLHTGAAAAGPSCGATLAGPTTLTADLHCSGTALVIGAPGITVNLAGHKLIGDGTGNGVDNSGGHDSVTISNGIIDHFENGVLLTNAAMNTLTRLTVRNNGVGIKLWLNDVSNTISMNTITNNLYQGIYVGCDPAAFTGAAADCHQKQSNGNLITTNTVTNNGRSGDESYGIQLQFAHENLVLRNTVSGHKGSPGHGICLLSSSDNFLQGNVVRWNGLGAMLSSDGFAGTADRNVISSNAFQSNDHGGAWVQGGTSSTELSRNTANGNGWAATTASAATAAGSGDGIKTDDGASVRLTRNVANQNGGHGMNTAAGPMVTDGGGNAAKLNRYTPQCVGGGVTCY